MPRSRRWRTCSNARSAIATSRKPRDETRRNDPARDDLRRRPRRAHAAAERYDAEAAAARRRQDADRASSRKARGGRCARDRRSTLRISPSSFRLRSATASRWGVRIRYSYEGEKPLETGGGIRHALPLLGDGAVHRRRGRYRQRLRLRDAACASPKRSRISSWCRIRRFIRAAISGSTARGSTRMAPASG